MYSIYFLLIFKSFNVGDLLAAYDSRSIILNDKRNGQSDIGISSK